MSPNAMPVCEWTHSVAAAAAAFKNNAAAAPPMFERGCCSAEKTSILFRYIYIKSPYN